MKKIRIGTRDSQLALWQAEWVRIELSKVYPSADITLVPVKTKGDKILDVALSKIGDKGLFTKELENALLKDEIDMAVHSLKDLPTVLPEGLTIAAYCKREEPRDVLLSKEGKTLEQLPSGSVIGTSSLRRIAQLKHFRPDLVFQDIRGNLQTRWRKLQETEISALVLAAAGVIRLGWNDRISQILPEEIMIPAVGQGSIAIEIASYRNDVSELIHPINDRLTEMAVKAERALMRRLEGGCQVPIGAYAIVKGNTIYLKAVVSSLDGKRLLRAEGEGLEPKQLGLSVAEELLAKGAKDILTEIR